MGALGHLLCTTLGERISGVPGMVTLDGLHQAGLKTPSTAGPSRSTMTTFSVWSCMILPPFTKQTSMGQSKKTILHTLHEKQQQHAWYDEFRHPDVGLTSLIERGVRGITSNHTVFRRAVLSESNQYYIGQFSQMMQEGNAVEDAYWGMVVKDIQDACDVLAKLFLESDGKEGYVSVYVRPSLTHKTDGQVEAAKWLHSSVNKPNVYIKIAATAADVPAIRDVISLGISVDVDSIFSIQRYEAVIDAYLEGLETNEEYDLSHVSSVATIYVSHTAAQIDRQLGRMGTEQALKLSGKTAKTQAALALDVHRQKFSGARWRALAKRGAKKQTLFWGPSTTARSSETAYADANHIWQCPLIGPEVVPRSSLGNEGVRRTVPMNLDEAQRVYDQIEELGIKWSNIGRALENEKVDSMQKSFDEVISTLVKLDLELLFSN